jgi:uncharacterized membrane protein YbjE (DUF340 family)
MFTGMAAGYIFRKRQSLFFFLGPATAWVIRLLLFLLGAGIAGDRALLAQVPVLGVKGLVLAVSTIIGSVTAGRLIIGRDLSSISPDEQLFRPAEESMKGEASVEGFPGRNRTPAAGSLIAAASFLIGLPAGILISGFHKLPFDPAGTVLYLLMFMVGLGAGADPTALSFVKKYGLRLFLLPLAVVAGTMAGALITALLWPALPIRESLAVGAGFGYYSLSSLLIQELSGGDWAAVALLSKIIREILTLLAAPFLVRAAGPSAPAAAGGATSMDTTLAATVQYSGRAWTVPALFSGIVLTLLTPFAVTLIMTV